MLPRQQQVSSNTTWMGQRAPASEVLRSLGAVYFYTTFIRAITSLLQIRQVARLRSTTCNLQGLSPTHRSTQTTPSRDLTLGVMQLATVRSPEPVGVKCLPPQAREPLQTIIPAGQKPRQGRQLKGGPRRRFEGPLLRAEGCGCSGCGCSSHPPCPRGKFLDRHENACSTNTSRHDTSRHTASCRPRCKSLHRNKHACRMLGGSLFCSWTEVLGPRFCYCDPGMTSFNNKLSSKKHEVSASQNNK
jgi:hypothetical protein